MNPDVSRQWSGTRTRDAPLVRFPDGEGTLDMQRGLLSGSLSLSVDQVAQVQLTLADTMDHTLARSRTISKGAHMHVGGFGFSIDSWRYGTSKAGPTVEVTALSGGVTRMRGITGGKSWGRVNTTAWFRGPGLAGYRAWQPIVQPRLGSQLILREKPEGGRAETQWDVMTHAAEVAGALIFEVGSWLVVGTPQWLTTAYWGQSRWVFQWNGWGTGSKSLAGMPELDTSGDGTTMKLRLVSGTRYAVRPGDRVQMEGRAAARMGMGGWWLVKSVDIPLNRSDVTVVECMRARGVSSTYRGTADPEASVPSRLPAPPAAAKSGTSRTATTKPAPAPAPKPATKRPTTPTPTPPRSSTSKPATPPRLPPALTPAPVAPAPLPPAPPKPKPATTPPVMVSSKDPLVKIIGRYLQNPEAIVKASIRLDMPVNIVAALVERETGGRHIYGNDVGGVFGRPSKSTPPSYTKTVTEQNYREFMRRIRAGELSNGVGPLQITWKQYHYDAEAEGLKLWRAEDNIYFGAREFLRLIRANGGSIIKAGTLYRWGKLDGDPSGKYPTGSSEYGVDVEWKSRVWAARIAGKPEPAKPAPPGAPVPVVRTGTTTPTGTPAGWAARWVNVKSASTGRTVSWPSGRVYGSGSQSGTSITKPLWDQLWAWVTRQTGVRVYGPYGAQCVDLSKAWAMKHGLRPGAYGHGKDFARGIASTGLFTFYGPTATAQSGDIVSWGTAFNPTYGHTAVVIADYGDTLRVFQQNPSAPALATVTKRGLAGYARPVKWDPRQ